MTSHRSFFIEHVKWIILLRKIITINIIIDITSSLQRWIWLLDHC